MESTSRTLLRLHVEAVWGIQLPQLTQDDVELAAAGRQPPWRLYLADVAGAQVAIWRADVAAQERAALRARAREALTTPFTERVAAQISREVALHQIAAPSMSSAAAQQIARPLTLEDHELVNAFEPASADYYFYPERRPLIGVIVAGRLLSLAHSSRRTPQACELGIDTLPEARRKGYALAATLLWAEGVTQEGLIPLYSASAANSASLRLAAAAGYRAFAQAASIEE